MGPPMSRCLVVQHVAPESAFAIEEALLACRVSVDTRRVFADDDLPADTSGFDGVVVMGGPMSAGSDHGFPTREAEIALLADALRSGVPTLGVCLGAQLVAVAAGGTVYGNAGGPEIGWAPVNLSQACHDDPLFADLPPTLTVLHWHGETLDVPAGGQLLIGNAACPHQAFRIGQVTWGVQFHLEVTVEAVEGFLTAFGHEAELVPGGAELLRSATPAALTELAPYRDVVCARFAALVAARMTRGNLVDHVGRTHS
jgi:GMP synthase-like glutamine amidotransferase